MISTILIPAGVFYPAAIATSTVALYYVALFVKQVIFKKPGGLFTAKF